MRRFIALVFLILYVIGTDDVRANENLHLVAITNKSISTLTKSDIHAYFSLRKQLLPSGNKVVLITLPLNSPETLRFSQIVFDYYPYQLARAWDARVFAGKGALPIEKPDKTSLIKFITATQASIGYLLLDIDEIDTLSEQVNVFPIEE